MKKTLYLILFALIFFINLFPTVVLSQSEYEYYEKLRLKRKERKIKVIKVDDAQIDYFDKEGYHIKREYYFEGNISSYMLIKHLSNGDLSVEQNLGSEGIWNTTGSQALFEETGFDPYNLIDDVVLIFDSKMRLAEKRISGEDYMGMDIEKYYYENDEDKPKRSEYYYDNQLSSVTNYYYDEAGLLIKSECYYDNQLSSVTNYYYDQTGLLIKSEILLNNEKSTINYSYEYY